MFVQIYLTPLKTQLLVSLYKVGPVILLQKETKIIGHIIVWYICDVHRSPTHQGSQVVSSAQTPAGASCGLTLPQGRQILRDAPQAKVSPIIF